MSGHDTRATICPSCGKMISRNEPQCPLCGASRAGAGVAEGLQKWMRGRGVTNLLFGANVLVFVVGFALTRNVADRPAGFMSFLSIDSEVSLRLGLFYGPLVAGEHDWYRLVTATFLHANLLHIAFNLWSLVSLGPVLEREYGWARFTLVYMAAGVSGWLACWLWGQTALGASGAIFGLLGAGWALGRRAGGTWGADVRGVFLRWAVSGVLYSLLMSGVSIPAHVGGLLGGAALGYLLAPRVRRMSSLVRDPPWLVVLAAALLAAVPLCFAWAAWRAYA
jgi:rhomboid protease GluP